MLTHPHKSEQGDSHPVFANGVEKKRDELSSQRQDKTGGKPELGESHLVFANGVEEKRDKLPPHSQDKT